jgi:predicted dienelactone hydrolase
MGIEVAALVVAGLAVGAEATFEVKAANAKEHALDLEADQMKLQSQQKSLQNYDVMEKVLNAQIAHQTTTGTAFSSPSFNAIQRNTLNIAAKAEKNINIEEELASENIKIEKQNVRDSLYAQLFGNVAQVASIAYTGARGMPKTGA